jgi:hypothetical protein
MFIFQASFISGMMLGIEFNTTPPRSGLPYHLSIVVDLLIVRMVFQKFKHVR